MMTTTSTKNSPSVAQPILVALGRVAQAQAAREREQSAGLSQVDHEARDRAMEEPERWDGMS